MKTVNIQETERHAHPGQDRRLPGVVIHSRPWRDPARSGVGIRATWLAPGSLSAGSLAGRTPLLFEAERRLNVQSGLRKDDKGPA